MNDRYMKVVLTIIAVNLTLIVGDAVLQRAIPEAWAQRPTVPTNVHVVGGLISVLDVGGTLDVRVLGGKLDYGSSSSYGPALKVCTQC